MTMYFFASLMRSRWRRTNLLQKFFLREKKNIAFSLDIQGCKLQQILSQKRKGFFGFKTKKFKLGGFATKKFLLVEKLHLANERPNFFFPLAFSVLLLKFRHYSEPTETQSLAHQRDTQEILCVTLMCHTDQNQFF